MNDRDETLDGMYGLICFLGEHPEIELPWFGTFNVWVNSRENFVRIARVMGYGEKGKDSRSIHLRKSLGGSVSLDLCMTHEIAGCRKVIVGQEWVPEEVKVVPGHMEDKIEWICDEALLAIEKEERQHENHEMPVL